jgi:hypothetical protein
LHGADRVRRARPPGRRGGARPRRVRRRSHGAARDHGGGVRRDRWIRTETRWLHVAGR